MHLAFRQVVAAPLEAVFAFLADPRNRPRWQASLKRIDMLDEGEPRIGMRWCEAPVGVGRFDMRIVEFERDRLWAEEFQGPAARGRIRLRFAPHAQGTRLDVEMDVALEGVRRCVGPVVKAALPWAMRHDLRKVERHLRG